MVNKNLFLALFIAIFTTGITGVSIQQANATSNFDVYSDPMAPAADGGDNSASTSSATAPTGDVKAVFPTSDYQNGDDLFTIATDIERKNALIKLRSENEKLALSLAKLESDKEAQQLKIKTDNLKNQMQAQAEEKKMADAKAAAEAEAKKKADIAAHEQKMQDLQDKLSDAIANDPNGDHKNLILLVKNENGGTLPPKFAYLDDTSADLNADSGTASSTSAKGLKNTNQTGVIQNNKNIKDILEIETISGIKNELIAVVKNLSTGRKSKITNNSKVDDYSVVEITSDSITFSDSNNKKYVLYMTSSN